MVIPLLPSGRFEPGVESALRRGIALAELLGHEVVQPAHLLYGAAADDPMLRMRLKADWRRVADAVEKACGGRGSGRPRDLSRELRQILDPPREFEPPTAEGLLNWALRPSTGAWRLPGGRRLREALRDACPDRKALVRALDEAPPSGRRHLDDIDLLPEKGSADPRRAALWTGGLDHMVGVLLLRIPPSFASLLQARGLDPRALSRYLLAVPSPAPDEAALEAALHRAWRHEEAREPAPASDSAVGSALLARGGDTVRLALEELGWTVFRLTGDADEELLCGLDLLREAAAQEARRQRVPRIEAYHLVMALVGAPGPLRDAFLRAGVLRSALMKAWLSAFPRCDGPDVEPEWGASAEQLVERTCRSQDLPPEELTFEMLFLELLDDPTAAGAFLRDRAGANLERLREAVRQLIVLAAYEEDDELPGPGELDLAVHLEVDGIPLGVGEAAVLREAGAPDVRVPLLTGQRWLWFEGRRVDFRLEERQLAVARVRGLRLDAAGTRVLGLGTPPHEAGRILGGDFERWDPGRNVRVRARGNAYVEWVELSDV